MSPRQVAMHDMSQDVESSPVLLNNEKNIIEFLNKDKNETTENSEDSDGRPLML